MVGGYLRVIRNPRYFPVWLGQLISNLGDTVNYVALVVWIFKITGSGLALSTLVLFQIVPAILIAPLAGVVIDRFPRKHVLIAADLVRAGLVVGLVFANAAWQIYVLAFGLALAGTFFTPALAASIPALVAGDDLLAANSVAWSTAQLVQILGSAVAGGLIALLDTRWAFGFNAASFLVSAGSIALVAFPATIRTVGSSPRAYFQSLREGMTYARVNPFVSRLMVIQVLASLSVGATSALLVVLAERRYHLPGAGFATFLFAIGLGAFLGPLILGAVTRNYRDRRLLFFPYIVRGAGDILLGLLTIPVLGQIVLLIYGLNTSSGMVTYQSVMQAEVPDAMRGRVFTLMDAGWNSSRLVSIALGGLLADRFGIMVVYYDGGALLIGAGLLGLLTVRLGTDRPTDAMEACRAT